MIHNASHQETEPQCTDPASLVPADRYEAGWNQAASIEDDTARHQLFRRYYRTGVDAFSKGFRDFTLGQHENASLTKPTTDRR